MKSIKINNDSYVELLKLKASLTARNGKARTFDEAIQELLRCWMGPIYVYDIPEEKVEEFIKNTEGLRPWLKYFSGESKTGKEGHVGMYYIVRREDASFPRSRE